LIEGVFVNKKLISLTLTSKGGWTKTFKSEFVEGEEHKFKLEGKHRHFPQYLFGSYVQESEGIYICHLGC